MIKLDLQYFGGRGGAGGKRTESSTSSDSIRPLPAKKPTNSTKEGTQAILNAPEGSKIRVEQFSSITGKPTGKTEEYELHNGTWSGRGVGSFENTPNGLLTRASKNGTTPGIWLENYTKPASKQPTHEERLASTRERARSLSTSMELRKAYRTAFSKEERKIYADELKRRGYKVPRGNIYHTNA